MNGETAVRALEPGMVFGRDFRVVRALRAGGMGAVYVVDQLSTGKQRALKVMAPELAVDPATRERFVLEARAASQIDSDHVVEIVTAGVDEQTGAPYIVMELLRGEELADALDRSGRIGLGDVAEVLAQAGHALERAHAQGIVHRDLKPENIFLAASRRRDASFTVKVLDFGIAKLVADSVQKTGTQPLGTPLFMSPEQTDRKGRITPATDVWAMGLIAFKLLTGRDFWVESVSLPVLLREIVVDPIPRASERARELGADGCLPAGFDEWFARCVNRDLDARFGEAGAAVRGFADLVLPDTARGQLIVTSTAHATGPVAPASALAVSATANALLIGTAPTHPSAGTGSAERSGPGRVASTTAAVSSANGGLPGPPSRVGGKVAVGLGATLLVGVAAGYLLLRPPAPDPAAASATEAPPATALASATATAAAPAGGCPEGMALIRGGKAFMGARDIGNDDAKPPHQVTLGDFCIDKQEVSTAAYEACFAKNDCERPLNRVSWPKISDDQKTRFSPLCNAGNKERSQHPINCVAWSMADNFCKKRGARLPTEAEWEYAARGSMQLTYPWGDAPPSEKRLNACGKECAAASDPGQPSKTMYAADDGFAATAPVGSFPEGASAEGVLDLAGNVWEWTSDWFGPYPSEPASDPKGPATGTLRVVRGGDFTSSKPEWARPAWRWKTDPDTYNHAIGFRCAATPR